MSQLKTHSLEFIRKQRERFLEELDSLVRIPSVSTDPQRRADMKRAAEWLVRHMEGIGVKGVEIRETGGHPLVYGVLETGSPREGDPTVMIYGHYDVQPEPPLEQWENPPFEPQKRGDRLYARGVSDMKAQILAVFNAVEALLHSGGELNSIPRLKLKFLFEGEEEIGSPNLPPFLEKNRELLASDVCLNVDAGMLTPELPTITYALRGIAYFELRLHGAAHDLHSGGFGGVVHNPAQVLCELIGGLHDRQGKVTLPGFYDRVRPLEEQERKELARLPIDEASLLKQTGVPALWGEAGYTPVERIGARPTLEVNGLLSGFVEEGAKTVLPAYAMAKISARLIPDQTGDEVHQQLLKYLEANAPATVKWELIRHAGGPAFLGDPRATWAQAISRALETVWGKRPVFHRSGGSVPLAGYLKQLLGIDSLLTGFSLPDDNAHAPNENLHLPTWYRGMEALVHFFHDLWNPGLSA